MLLRNQARRPAAHLVESALVFPITFLLVVGLVVCAMGVFRYQQTAYLARVAARYAAVHAGQYQQENAAAITAGTLPNVNESYITTNIVNTNAAGMNTAYL